MSIKKPLYLPYRITTDTLEKIAFSFELSDKTQSPTAVQQLLSKILVNITEELKLKKISNGDIIQSICMTLAVRLKMINAKESISKEIAIEAIEKAFQGFNSAVKDNSTSKLQH